MKNLARTILVSAILMASGFGASSGGDNLCGKWRGTLTEKGGKSTLVELELREKTASIQGTLTILSETGEKIDKGTVLPIVQAKRSGDKVKFIVPISGKVDDDAIVFELMIEGNRLKGHAHELRKGSDNVAINFAKQE